MGFSAVRGATSHHSESIYETMSKISAVFKARLAVLLLLVVSAFSTHVFLTSGPATDSFKEHSPQK
jgi:hypothetical protein